jgi:probable phosphomutase (TIGR03848 family)
MPTLLLIRHGENDYLKKNKMPGRLPGIHLNERGREQALALAETLKGLPIKAIYASPLERAIETAKPLAESHGLEIQLQPGLMDTDVGAWTGRSWKALRRMKEWKTVQKKPSEFQFPDGETFAQTQERVVAALKKIAKAHKKDEIVAVIFHSDPIKLAVAHFIGLPLDNFQRLTSSTGSVTVLFQDGASAKLLALNLIPPFSFPKM